MRASAHVEDQSIIPFGKIKRYIAYCRSKCHPRLSEAAAKTLANKYVNMREQHRMRELGATGNSIPITVRQLEAIVRLSEALAKMRLADVASETDVVEAIRLFTVSTVDAINSGTIAIDEHMDDKTKAELEHAENMIRRTLQVNSSRSERKLVSDISKQYNLDEKLVRRAIQLMAAREEVQYLNKGKIIKRVR